MRAPDSPLVRTRTTTPTAIGTARASAAAQICCRCGGAWNGTASAAHLLPSEIRAVRGRSRCYHIRVRRSRFARRLVVAFSGALLASLPTSASSQEAAGTNAAAVAQRDALQQRMLSDPEILRNVEGLRDDPTMRAVLADPALAAALERGDLSALMADPKIRRLAEHPAVQDITRQVAE
jgi:hypothetical protein